VIDAAVPMQFLMPGNIEYAGRIAGGELIIDTMTECMI
jgi:hypothetical protein